MEDGSLNSGTRLGPYEIEILIGKGGMGHVYRARDPRLGRNVALKTLSPEAATDPDSLRRFETEAIAAGTLDHPNLLVVYDVGRQDTVSYIVSELLDGETLRSRLARQGALPEKQVIEISRQVVHGLAAAHARGIIHRDLKPENIFLTRDKRVKILDFGVAKLSRMPEGVPSAAGTRTGVIVGTVGYMAPEQVVGEPVDHRADIFALGVVMYEMLTGTAPFKRDAAVTTLYAIVSEEPAELPATASPGLRSIVSRCLEKERDQRFHSAHDLGLALELLGTNSDPTLPSLPKAPEGIPAPGTVPRRQALVYGASAVALVATGFAAGRFLGGPKLAPLPNYQRLTFRRGLIRSARFAPDGETFLYSALWEGGPCRIYSGRIGGTESVPLDLPDATVQAVSRNGELAITLGSHRDGIITNGTLARAPMGGGAPRELATDVKSADWSPDGRDLAIIRLVDGRNRLEYPLGQVRFAPDGTQKTGMSFVRVSPDGHLIAFVHTVAQSSITGAVTIVDQAGNVTALTGEYVNIHGLTWRGNELWYTASDDRPLFRSIHAIRPGEKSRLVARMPTNVTVWDANAAGNMLLARTDDRAVMTTHIAGDVGDRDLSWLDASWAADIARDGSAILFDETGQGGGLQTGGGSTTFSVYLRRVDGSAPIRLASGQGLALSPDLRWALVAPVVLSFGGESDYLSIVPTGPGETQRLSTEGFAVWRARWLPDGKQIALWGREQDKGVVVSIIDVASGQRRVLAPDRVWEFAVSPDGQAVAANVSSKLGIYPVAGGPPRPVPAEAKGDLIGWITEGLLFTGSQDLGEQLGDVYLVDPVSGRRHKWRNIRPRDEAGIMLLVRQFVITPDGRSWAYTWHRAMSDLYLAEGLV